MISGIQAKINLSWLDKYALTSVYDIRTFLGMPANALTDDLVYRFENLINGASAILESKAARKFKARSWEEIYDGRKTTRFLTQHFPILSVQELWIDPTSEFTNPIFKVSPSEFAIMDGGESILLKNRTFGGVPASVKIVYRAGYEAIPYDIRLAANLLVEWLYRFNEREDIGRTTRSKGDESVNLDQSFPRVIDQIIDPYIRLEIGGASPVASKNL